MYSLKIWSAFVAFLLPVQSSVEADAKTDADTDAAEADTVMSTSTE